MSNECEINEEIESTVVTAEIVRFSGYLSKWTNYIHGWQRRWFILKDGSLCYSKTKEEVDFGCRGAISLFKAGIKTHEVDNCRFDVSVKDCIWSLRADTSQDRIVWLENLRASKGLDSGYGSENSLRSTSSDTSTQSNKYLNNTKRLINVEAVKTNVLQLDALKNTFNRQLDEIQSCLMYSANILDDPPAIIKGDYEIDCDTFKEQIGLAKDTAGDILDILEKCSTIMDEKQKKENEDYPNDITNDILPIKPSTSVPQINVPDDVCINQSQSDIEEKCSSSSPKTYEFVKEIDQILKSQVEYARMGIGEGGWELFAEEGEMKMYRREDVCNGLVVDPLKACHFVPGFTAREMCDYFFKPKYRYEWETTLEPKGMTVIDELDENTIIFHQIHKRIWPAAQRDALFWSHMREVPKSDHDDDSVYNCWAVINQSTESPSYPPNVGKYIRVFLTICLFCETIILKKKPNEQLERGDIACKITYCAVVNPGGWAPSSALRLVYKREYPRFLRKFTAYVTSKTKDIPIRM